MKVAFLLTALFLMPAPTLLAQTNEYFVTEEDHTNKYFIPTPEQIKQARHAKESRPAKEDPEGNWGAVNEGFQLSIRLSKSTFTNGEPVVATIILRNVHDKPLTYYVFYPFDDDLKLYASSGNSQLPPKKHFTSNMSFQDKLHQVNNGSRSAPVLPPGVQRAFKITLNDFYDLSTNGQYSVYATRSVRTIDQSSETNVISKSATFSIK